MCLSTKLRITTNLITLINEHGDFQKLKIFKIESQQNIKYKIQPFVLQFSSQYS